MKHEQNQSWGLLTTHGKMPLKLFKHCFESWQPYYNELFVWVNNNANCDLWKYLYDNSTAMLLSPLGKGRSGWIREVPYQMARLMSHVPRVMKHRKPQVVVHFDEDELAPQHPDFPAYYKEWLESDSEAMLFRWIYFWENLETVRADKVAATTPHGFFFKAKPELTWTVNYLGHGCAGTNLHNKWLCPYPVGHFNKYTAALREFHLKHRKEHLLVIPDNERPKRWRIDPKNIVLTKYNPLITTQDLGEWQSEIEHGSIPKGCWQC